MKIKRFNDSHSMDLYGCDIVVDFIKNKSNSLLSVATGNSTIGLYKELKKYSKDHYNFFSKVLFLKLDEWLIGDKTDKDGFCEHYIQSNIIKPLNIDSERYISFDAKTQNPIKECERIYSEIKNRGSIDICILGLGKNGHIGFIEPGAPIYIKPYIADLSETSQSHEMISNSNNEYKKGLTLSINQILSSKKVILFVSGEGKQKAISKLLSGKISTDCPASFLWLHNDVECLIYK
jgi:galactosamine-6-phosphate isomerase